MEIDLHTIRNVSDWNVAEWALSMPRWAIVGMENELGGESSSIISELIRRGIEVEIVCSRCAEEGKSIFGKNTFSSIQDMEPDVEVLCVVGDVDLWALNQEISQRMQWYGDIRCIWIPSELDDERWRSEMYDYGFAVISEPEIKRALQ